MVINYVLYVGIPLVLWMILFFWSVFKGWN